MSERKALPTFDISLTLLEIPSREKLTRSLVTKNFRRLVRTHHPDTQSDIIAQEKEKFGSSPTEARLTEQVRDIIAAYNLLKSDLERRGLWKIEKEDLTEERTSATEDEAVPDESPAISLAEHVNPFETLADIINRSTNLEQLLEELQRYDQELRKIIFVENDIQKLGMLVEGLNSEETDINNLWVSIGIQAPLAPKTNLFVTFSKNLQPVIEEMYYQHMAQAVGKGNIEFDDLHDLKTFVGRHVGPTMITFEDISTSISGFELSQKVEDIQGKFSLRYATVISSYPRSYAADWNQFTLDYVEAGNMDWQQFLENNFGEVGQSHIFQRMLVPILQGTAAHTVLEYFMSPFDPSRSTGHLFLECNSLNNLARYLAPLNPDMLQTIKQLELIWKEQRLWRASTQKKEQAFMQSELIDLISKTKVRAVSYQFVEHCLLLLDEAARR